MNEFNGIRKQQFNEERFKIQNTKYNNYRYLIHLTNWFNDKKIIVEYHVRFDKDES